MAHPVFFSRTFLTEYFLLLPVVGCGVGIEPPPVSGHLGGGGS